MVIRRQAASGLPPLPPPLFWDLPSPLASHSRGAGGGGAEGVPGCWQRIPSFPSQPRRCLPESGVGSQDRQTFWERMSSLSLEASKPRLGTHLVELEILEGAPCVQGGGSLLALRSSPPEPTRGSNVVP